MTGIVGIPIPLPRDRRRPTLREIARLLVAAREIEKMHIHATADNCPAHGMLAHLAAPALIEILPRRLRNNEQMHKRITAPAAREYARRVDA